MPEPNTRNQAVAAEQVDAAIQRAVNAAAKDGRLLRLLRYVFALVAVNVDRE